MAKPSREAVIVAWCYVGIQCLIAIISCFASFAAVNDKKNKSGGKIIKLWVKSMWKMRKIYSAFAVHIFDFMTDLLVIAEWYNAEQTTPGGVENVDSRLMAQVSIGILVFYKCISSAAVYLTTERNLLRAFLQFLDLLLFEEILIAHSKLVTQLTGNTTHDQPLESIQILNVKHSDNNDNKDLSEKKEQKQDTDTENRQDNETGKHPEKDKGNSEQTSATSKHPVTTKPVDEDNNEAIESTIRFKYIRQLEALFEATPQATLQLVYLMRTGEFNDVIIGISILQSIVSLTTSMINADNAYMTRGYFKEYKKRFPPSIKFSKHAFLRLCEIAYRVGLFSIFWTVVGGEGFIVLLIVELSLVIMLLILKYLELYDQYIGKSLMTSDMLFLALNQIIVLPPELMLESDEFEYHISYNSCSYLCGHWLCYCLFCAPIGWLLMRPCCKNELFSYAAPRVGMSFVEWGVIILFGYFDLMDKNETNYLFDTDHCLYFFIVSMCMFVVYTQFEFFMPDIRLPNSVSIRSKYGYAFLGDITELERLGGIDDIQDVGSEKNKDKSEKMKKNKEFWDETIERVIERKNLESWLHSTMKTSMNNISNEDVDSDENPTLMFAVMSAKIAQVIDYLANNNWTLEMFFRANENEINEKILSKFDQVFHNNKEIEDKREELANKNKDEAKTGDAMFKSVMIDKRTTMLEELVELENEYFDEKHFAKWFLRIFNDLKYTYGRIEQNFECCALYALAAEQFHVVKWLEKQGCDKHIILYQTDQVSNGNRTLRDEKQLYTDTGVQWARRKIDKYFKW